MKFKAVTLAAAFVALSGCQAGYITETYSKTPKQVVQTKYGTFWVFDRPDIRKIMTTPAPGEMVGPAMVSGLSAGLVDVDPTLSAHREAADVYFKKNGRHCDTRAARELWRPEWEQDYVCD